MRAACQRERVARVLLSSLMAQGQCAVADSGYSTLDEQPATVPAAAERGRLRSCELHASASV